MQKRLFCGFIKINLPTGRLYNIHICGNLSHYVTLFRNRLTN